MIPVLYITYGRLEFTKQSLPALLNSDSQIAVVIIDNNSKDETKEYLKTLTHKKIHAIIYNEENTGIAGAMNSFLEITKGMDFVAKLDNDSVPQKNWCTKLKEKLIKCDLDVIQAKHELIPAVANGLSFDEWMKTMKQHQKDKSVYLHHFVGGSGIVFRRNKIDKLPETEWKLYSWRQYQREHPELRTAFTTDVEIHLLDSGGKHVAYPEYYKETRRSV